MESDLRSIGELARASGLTVSALRFYDGAGVLIPAVVDSATGYRWYAEHQLRSARLVAGLRRVGMPLAEITDLLARCADPVAVRRLLDAHLRRLEDGLADARRELTRIHALLNHEEIPMTDLPIRLTMPRAEFAAALDSVRFAVSHDPALPALGGVLFEVDGAVLRLVATDRYRLAVTEAPASTATTALRQVIAPASFVNAAHALLVEPGTEEATLTIDQAGITLRAGQRQVSGQPLDHDFPDHRRLFSGRLDDGDVQRFTIDVAALRATITGVSASTVVREWDSQIREITVLTVDPAGVLTVAEPDAPADNAAVRVGVDREFLLDALEVGGRDQLVLELDGPIKPLVLRRPDDDRTFSLLMPIRLQPAGSGEPGEPG